MAATLAAYKPPPAAAANDINLVPLPDMPKQVVFRDKREAMEALKDLLKGHMFSQTQIILFARLKTSYLFSFMIEFED